MNYGQAKAAQRAIAHVVLFCAATAIDVRRMLAKPDMPISGIRLSDQLHRCVILHFV
jgi:hypothetical protein